MSDEVKMKAQEEVGRRNAKAAIQHSLETRETLQAEHDALAQAFVALSQKVAELEQKYNLLLTRNFNGGPTSGD